MSVNSFKRMQIVIMSTLIVTSVLALRSIVSAKEEYRFHPKVSIERLDMTQLSYKELRSREICEMAKTEGFTDKNCVMMIAHLQTECGSMDEYCGWTKGSYRSDAGLAFGIAQWHLCYREAEWMKENKFGCPHGNPKKAGVIRDKFFADHPDMKDWRKQAERYIREMKSCTATKQLRQCIDNWNAHPSYMKRVDSKVSMAKELLF